MVTYLVRRLALGAVVVLLTAVFAIGGWRALRPDQFPGEPLVSSTLHQLERYFFHLDFGVACEYLGCPKIHDLWVRGIRGDLWLLGLSLIVGPAIGLAAGSWCASRRGSLRARAIEAVGMFFFCTPPFVLGYGLLLLFAPDFGLLPFQPLFEVHSYTEPLDNPVDFLRSMVIPVLVVSLPLAAACLRLTLGTVSEAAHEEYVRTARAKGVGERDAVRVHARPAAYVAVSSYVGATVQLVVTNMVLAEAVFSVPGFFVHTRRALGQTPGYPPGIDPPTLQAMAVWAAVMIVVVGIAADVALVALDPRIRARGRV
ncbi:MAG: peptide/nickel transport system permease protein [Solirubrobacteraceae bacterium]|nr:peptide/nickel transport system permease protein [Solirubrobacteraceae bacterium]